MARSAAALCLAALLLCSGALMAAAADAEQAGDTSAVGSGEAAAVAEGAASATPQQRPPFIVLRHQDSWLLEGLAVAFLLTFLVNMLIGRRRNERLALAWTAELVAPDGVLDRNFALLGPGDTAAGEVLLKDSMHCFKLWASGRRFCQGMLATLQLVRRQDMLAYTVMALQGQKDVLELEVRMNEGALPPLVLAIGQPSVVRNMALDSEDIKTFCKRLEVTRDRIPNWPDKLAVWAEHSSIFYDLMGPQLLDLFFSKEAFQPLKPYFRFLLITSEAPEGHNQVIRLSFVLPPAGEGTILPRLLTLACLLIDLMGSYRLSPEQQKRATDARAKREAAARASEQDEMRKRAEERRMAKLQEEQERLRKLPPEQREKELAKRQKLQQRRRMMRAGKNM